MTNFFDKIEPRGWLGKGGFGSVYEASDGPERVAVKIIQLKPKTRDKQQHELELHLLFDHPNIVRCFAGIVTTRDLTRLSPMWSGGYEEEDDEDESYTESESSGSSEGEAKEFLYLKLELCGKLNLQGWLDNLDTDYKSIAYKLSAMKILEGLASGLAYLHGGGIMHRDIKPANILFKGVIPKICDFGLAKKVLGSHPGSSLDPESGQEPVAKHTKGAGSVLYMSPEQLNTNIYNEKTDIYSLGLIFFKLIFPKTTEMEIGDIRRKPPSKPEDFEPRSVFKLFLSMISTEPSHRPGAEEILEQCRRISLELKNLQIMD